MKLLFDECLAHTYVRRLADRGYPAIHPIHVGLRPARDDQLAARALTDDHVIVRSNARDFRPPFAASDLYPGAILVE